MKRELTKRQQDIYGFIRTTVESKGIPPTIREIGERFGIRSTNGVDKHLQALERAGHISRQRGASRGIALSADRRPLMKVPLLGRVAAGLPVFADENREGEFGVDGSLFGMRNHEPIFALQVHGESMIDAHIMEGDTILVREGAHVGNGDIVVAMVDGETTVKRFFLEDGKVRLQPENKAMRPFFIERGDLRLIGKVIGVIRKIS